MSIRSLFVLLYFALPLVKGCAQTDTISAISKRTERDMSDVMHSLFHKKKTDTRIGKNNERKYQFSFVPAIGYTLQTGFAGILSANLAYKADTNPTTKVSSLSTSFTYSQYKQSIIPFLLNIWTKNNKFNIISDNRFIQYPSDIYGLGGRTDPNQGITINFSGLKLHETILRSINKNLFVGVGYYFDKFWNIKADSLKRREAIRFARTLGKSEVSSGITFKVLYDNRLNQINPSNGFFANIVLRSNTRILGSQSNWKSLLLDVRKYVTFPKTSKNVLSFWSMNWLTLSGTPPYLIMPSTGWDDQYNTGRGYIQGRFRGDNLYYFESEYRFRISRDGLFGGVVFANAEKFSGEISKQFKSIAPGYGLGLRLKLNKYSGTNLCIDYGFGENGSKGFFVNLGEVF